MAPAKNVALAITSYYGPLYEDGAKTGAFYSEVYHPFEVFTKAGFGVTIVSETGTYGWDEHSLHPDFAPASDLAHSKDPNDPFAKALANVKAAKDVDPKQFGVLFAAGGHGTVFDFVGKAPGLFELGTEIWAQGGIVGAVCHGPCLIPGIKDKSTGASIGKGRKVTGFPDSGEVILNLKELLDREHLAYTSDVIRESGAEYIDVEPPFDVKVVTDGRLVSGGNPSSAAPTAEATVKAYEAL